MKRLMLFAPAVVLAAACSSETSTIQPGQWETTIRFTSMEIPGMTEAMAKQMQSQLGNRTQTYSSCITPEQAARPGGGVLAQNPEGCQFEEQNFSGGVIRVRGTCRDPNQQAQVRMSWEGRYTGTTMQATMTNEVTGAPQGTMRMTGTLDSRRTGDCASRPST